jgi:hypothetical protein
MKRVEEALAACGKWWKEHPGVQRMAGLACGIVVGIATAFPELAAAEVSTNDVLMDGEDFVGLAKNAIGMVRVIGIFVVGGGLVASAINFWTGSHESKGLLWKTILTGIIIIMAPSIMNFIIDSMHADISTANNN